MFELKTRAFSLTGNSLTDVVEQWMRQRTVVQDYADLIILSIEKVDTPAATTEVTKETTDAI